MNVATLLQSDSDREPLMSVVTQQQYVARAGFCKMKIAHYDFGMLSLMVGLLTLSTLRL